MARRRTIQPHRNPKFLKLFFEPNAENPNDRTTVIMDYENEYRKIALRATPSGVCAWVDLANQKRLKVTIDRSKKGELNYVAEVNGEKGFYRILENKRNTQLIWGENTLVLEERINTTHEHYLSGKDTALEIEFMRKGAKQITSLECSFVIEGYEWPMVALCLHRFMAIMKIEEPKAPKTENAG